MGLERTVVSPFTKGRKLTMQMDYEALEVGDWFIVRSKAVRSTVVRSMPRNPVAKTMSFAWSEIEPHVFRVERTA